MHIKRLLLLLFLLPTLPISGRFKPAHPMLDAEVCRVVSTMSSWKPGLKNGKVVRSYVLLPIDFKLSNNP